MVLEVELPGNSRVIYELQNSGHTLLLCLITFGFLYPAHRYWFPASLWRAVASAITLSLLFSGASEFIQPWFGRDSSWEDLYQDLLGILAGLLFYFAFISRVKKRYLNAALAWLVVLFGLSDPIIWFYAKELRDKKFPLLADFESGIGSRFYEARYGAVLARVPAPEAWQTNESTVAQVEFKSGTWPGINAFDLRGNWGAYQQLVLEIYNPHSEILEIVVRIHDEKHNGQHDDRFNQTFQLAAGLNELAIPVERIAKTRSGRNQRMNKVRVMMVYMSRPQRDYTLYFDNFRLE